MARTGAHPSRETGSRRSEPEPPHSSCSGKKRRSELESVGHRERHSPPALTSEVLARSPRHPAARVALCEATGSCSRSSRSRTPSERHGKGQLCNIVSYRVRIAALRMMIRTLYTAVPAVTQYKIVLVCARAREGLYTDLLSLARRLVLFYTGLQLVRLYIESVSSCAELLSVLYSSQYYTVAPCRASQMASWI